MDDDRRADIANVLVHAGDWLVSRRWFGDKRRQIRSIQPVVVEPVHLEGGQYALATVEISFAEGEPATYFLPLVVTDSSRLAFGTIRGSGQALYVGDALEDVGFLRWLLHMAVSSGSVGGAGAAWRWRLIGDRDSELTAALRESPQLLTGEQSNSSVRYGDHLIAKVFRRLQPGINPDIEVGSFLRTATTFEHIPAMLATAELMRDRPWSVVAYQAFQPNEGDCWTWLLAHITKGVSDVAVEVLDALCLLGDRTAELHLALASNGEAEAFRPEPFGELEVGEEIERVQAELHETFELLRSGEHANIDLDRARERLVPEIKSLSLLRETVRIRIHGDFHLGQVLRTADGDISILDFEGEPARPVAERRKKASALRDVAGMLRSLDYACAYVERNRQENATLVISHSSHATRLRSAFLKGYRRRVAQTSPAIVPKSGEDFDRALRALEIQKALYEVRYELNNRPDWVSIPLAALFPT